MSYRLNIKNHCYWLENLLVAIICFSLAACGGGISGTGDGGPIITVDGSGDMTGNGDSATSEADGSIAVTVSTTQLQIFPSTLHENIDETLLAASTLNSRFPDLQIPTLSQQLATQLKALQQQSLQTLQRLAVLEAQEIDILLRCDTTTSCDSLPTMVAGEFTPDPANGSTQMISLSSISYSPQIAGYFDKQLTFTVDSYTTVLRWTTDQQFISLVTENSSANLTMFSNFTQSRTTLRREDKFSSAILQAALQSSGTATSIEADFQNDQQHFIRASAGNGSLALYAIHPTDATIKQVREGFSLNTNQYAIDSCLTENEFCNEWQSDHSSSNTSINLFDDSGSILGDFSQSLASDLNVALPDVVNEFVIASGTNQPEPAPQSLVCGGQRVFNAIRTFCWQPLPLDISVQFFEESKNNGSTVYRLLPNASIQ